MIIAWIIKVFCCMPLLKKHDQILVIFRKLKTKNVWTSICMSLDPTSSHYMSLISHPYFKAIFLTTHSSSLWTSKMYTPKGRNTTTEREPSTAWYWQFLSSDFKVFRVPTRAALPLIFFFSFFLYFPAFGTERVWPSVCSSLRCLVTIPKSQVASHQDWVKEAWQTLRFKLRILWFNWAFPRKWVLKVQVIGFLNNKIY